MEQDIKLFYCIYQNKKAIDHHEPISIKGVLVKELIDEVTAMKENFIGFIDKDDNTIQFFTDGVDEIWMEIPVPSKKGSYGAYINRKQMYEVIENLQSPFIEYKEQFELDFHSW